MSNMALQYYGWFVTLRNLRCPHFVLLSPVWRPGTAAIKRTLKKIFIFFRTLFNSLSNVIYKYSGFALPSALCEWVIVMIC